MLSMYRHISAAALHKKSGIKNFFVQVPFEFRSIARLTGRWETVGQSLLPSVEGVGISGAVLVLRRFGSLGGLLGLEQSLTRRLFGADSWLWTSGFYFFD